MITNSTIDRAAQLLETSTQLVDRRSDCMFVHSMPPNREETVTSTHAAHMLLTSTWSVRWAGGTIR